MNTHNGFDELRPLCFRGAGSQEDIHLVLLLDTITDKRGTAVDSGGAYSIAVQEWGLLIIGGKQKTKSVKEFFLNF